MRKAITTKRGASNTKPQNAPRVSKTRLVISNTPELTLCPLRWNVISGLYEAVEYSKFLIPIAPIE
jgi:hypothetical protein